MNDGKSKLRDAVEDVEQRKISTYLAGDELHTSRECQGVPEVSHSTVVVDGGQINVQLSHRDIRSRVASAMGHNQAETGQLTVAVQVVFLA